MSANAAINVTAVRTIGIPVADPEVIPYPVPMFTLRDPDGNTLVVVQAP